MEPQLVGLKCVFCDKTIGSVVEGQYCSACGAPHHNACAKKPVSHRSVAYRRFGRNSDRAGAAPSVAQTCQTCGSIVSPRPVAESTAIVESVQAPGQSIFSSMRVPRWLWIVGG